MGLKFFTIPAMHAEQWEAELNGFLAAHRVNSVHQAFDGPDLSGVMTVIS